MWKSSLGARVTLLVAFAALASLYWSPSFVGEFYSSKYIEIALASSTPWIYFPYAVLLTAVYVSRVGHERIVTTIISCNAMSLGAFSYWDAVYFCRIFPWKDQGTVIEVTIWVQMAIGLAMLAVLFLRRWKESCRSTQAKFAIGH